MPPARRLRVALVAIVVLAVIAMVTAVLASFIPQAELSNDSTAFSPDSVEVSDEDRRRIEERGYAR